MAYTDTEDNKGRQVEVPVTNEAEDGSGTWHQLKTDSDGTLIVAGT